MKEITMPGLHSQLEKLIKALNLDSTMPVLDVGCGTGAWLHRLSSIGFTDLFGIDKNQILETEKSLFFQRDLDSDDWNLPNKNFSLITAIEVIEHLANLDIFFLNIEQYLSENGLCLITTPNVHALENRLSFLISGCLPAFHSSGDPTHITPILLISLERQLLKYNLELVSISSWPHVAYFRLEHFGNAFILKLLSKILKFFLPNPYPGDNLIIVIRKNSLQK